jgi:hypothetical protein
MLLFFLPDYLSSSHLCKKEPNITRALARSVVKPATGIQLFHHYIPFHPFPFSLFFLLVSVAFPTGEAEQESAPDCAGLKARLARSRQALVPGRSTHGCHPSAPAKGNQNHRYF